MNHCNLFNTLKLTQNGHHVTDILKCIFLNENIWISIDISLNFVSKGEINNIPALVQIMAWHPPDDKPLSEPMMVSLLIRICITRPQLVNKYIPKITAIYPRGQHVKLTTSSLTTPSTPQSTCHKVITYSLLAWTLRGQEWVSILYLQSYCYCLTDSIG